jgi:hypothetical protein
LNNDGSYVRKKEKKKSAIHNTPPETWQTTKTAFLKLNIEKLSARNSTLFLRGNMIKSGFLGARKVVPELLELKKGIKRPCGKNKATTGACI